MSDAFIKNNEIKIAVIGAMTEEIIAIKHSMDKVKEINLHGKLFYEGELNGTSFVLTQSGVGKVSSTISVSLLKAHYPINNLVFTGIAGAVNPSLNVGDIVISNKLFQHDMDSRPNFPIYEVPYLEQAIFSANNALIEKAEKATNTLLEDNIIISTFSNNELGIKVPKCIQGIIGSGDQFITDEREIDKIKTLLMDNYSLELDCVEMEGAAVAQSCYELNIPFVVIRTISDKPKEMSIKNYKAFKTQVASQYSKHIIEYMLTFL